MGFDRLSPNGNDFIEQGHILGKAMPAALAPRLRSLLKPLAWIGATVLALPFLYLLAALVLGAIPANADWREPEEGVTIFLRTNGVHTWIVVPKTTPDMDWRPLVPGDHLADPRWGNADHVGFGFGEEDFYLNTPTWGDLTLGTAIGAIQGSGLVHADHIHDPRPDEWQRPLRITRGQYRRLASFILDSFVFDEQGDPIPLLGTGYGPSDIFYKSDGRYTAISTCNEWTGDALRSSGIRTGLWTPFAQSIMWRLD